MVTERCTVIYLLTILLVSVLQRTGYFIAGHHILIVLTIGRFLVFDFMYEFVNVFGPLFTWFSIISYL